ncbi:hypothetical protein HW555_005425 [Spodoptera exigua]|uniref:Uncharacterized protein n=1 Tax=Spodoptera exigua TaxID=7107 RepID=A0A835L5H2_SPOEX|nr:hypothetical protein HW555_005425 [Spodoptera exigua]
MRTVLGERGYDVPERGERLVDARGLPQALGGRARLALPLAARQVHQVQLAHSADTTLPTIIPATQLHHNDRRLKCSKVLIKVSTSPLHQRGIFGANALGVTSDVTRGRVRGLRTALLLTASARYWITRQTTIDLTTYTFTYFVGLS